MSEDDAKQLIIEEPPDVTAALRKLASHPNLEGLSEAIKEGRVDDPDVDFKIRSYLTSAYHLDNNQPCPFCTVRADQIYEYTELVEQTSPSFVDAPRWGKPQSNFALAHFVCMNCFAIRRVVVGGTPHLRGAFMRIFNPEVFDVG